MLLSLFRTLNIILWARLDWVFFLQHLHTIKINQENLHFLAALQRPKDMVAFAKAIKGPRASPAILEAYSRALVLETCVGCR